MYQQTESQAEQIRRQLKEQGRSIALEDELSRASAHADAALKAAFQEKLHYVYPHAALEGLTVKTTVSELKKASYGEAAAEAAELIVLPRERYIPDFALEEMQEMTDVSELEQTTGHARKAQSGIQYGTAVHKIMELLSFSEKFRTENKHLLADIKSEQEKWITDGTVTADELACVGVHKLQAFFQSSLSQRMIAANGRNELFKEQPFVLRLIAVVHFVVIASVIGQMKLPVHGKLRKHIGCSSHCARSHFFINIIIGKAYGIIAVRGFSKLREIVVCDFRVSVASLVDIVADFMGNSPAKIISVKVPALLILCHGRAGRQSRY